MHTINLDLMVNSPPEAVWAVVGSFGSIAEWHPGIAACTLSKDEKGKTLRTLKTAAHGDEVVERLTEHDDGSMLYSYSLVKSPVPLTTLTGEFYLIPDYMGHTRIRWLVNFEVVKGAPEDKVVQHVEAELMSAGPALTARFGAM